MTWEPRPLPDVSPETREFWRAAADGTLVLNECDACGLVFFYPRSHCPDCFDQVVSTVAAAGTGELYSYSVSEDVNDWPERALPLILAYVELDEGPRLLTNLVECAPKDMEVGDRVEVSFVPTERDDVAIPVFSPME